MNDFRLSHSAVDDYTTCPEKYRLTRQEKVPRAPGWSLVGGNAVHNVTASLDLLDFGIDDGTPKTFVEAFLLEADRVEADSGTPRAEWHCAGRVSKDKPNKEDEAWWLAVGQQYVDNWRDWLNASAYSVWIQPTGEPAIEIGIELSEADGFGGVPWRGFIDRVMERDGTLGVVDLKTGARTPATLKQTAVYRLAIGKTLGWQYAPSWGAFFMNRTGELTQPMPLWNDYPLERVEYEYGLVARGVREGVFPARPGPLCSSCGVRKYCFEFGGEKAAEVQPW